MRVAIANDLMKEGRYDEAWPYAEAAARTWAGWAMTCAQNCAEGLEKWEAAEGYARASSERYPGSMWAVWFLFCERTGHGDIAAARAFTKEMSADLLESPNLSTDTLILITYVQLLCGDNARAAAALRRMPRDTSEMVYVISMAATADLAGADDLRDTALERFCTAFKTDAPKTDSDFTDDPGRDRCPETRRSRSKDHRSPLRRRPEFRERRRGLRGRCAPDGTRPPRSGEALLAHRSRTDRTPTFGGESSLSRSCVSTTKTDRATEQGPARSDPRPTTQRINRSARRTRGGPHKRAGRNWATTLPPHGRIKKLRPKSANVRRKGRLAQPTTLPALLHGPTS